MKARIETLGEIVGQPVKQVVIGDLQGFHVALSSFGASITQCHAPGAEGYADVVLGLETFEDTKARRDYHGATCGRFANRIRNGRFFLDGQECVLGANEGSTSLHGGPDGFDRRNWSLVGASDNEATFSLHSPDGDGGYPGALESSVAYRVNGDTLSIEITASVDQPTMINLVNHSYWNLDGHDAGSISNHLLQINATRRVAVDKDLLPTGELPDVEGSAFDFRTPKPIGHDIPTPEEGGYDLCFCVDETRGRLHPMATAISQSSGRKLDIWSTEIGLQFYTAEHFDCTGIGKGGVKYGHRGAIALETQAWPDTPNQPGFPSARLDPGQTYSHITELRFSRL